jgi:amino acid transporter
METTQGGRSVSSVIALVLAVVALLLSAIPIINNFAFVLAILALIFGFIGLRRTKKGQRRGRKTSIISIVLAVLAAAVVLISQSLYGNVLDKTSKDLDKVGKEAQTSLDKASGKKTNDILGKEVDVTIDTFQVISGQYTTETQLPVKVTNKNSQSKSYSIQIEAVDQSGTRIADDTVYANNLSANQSQDFKAFQYVQSDKVDALKAAKFKVASVSQY